MHPVATPWHSPFVALAVLCGVCGGPHAQAAPWPWRRRPKPKEVPVPKTDPRPSAAVPATIEDAIAVQLAKHGHAEKRACKQRLGLLVPVDLDGRTSKLSRVLRRSLDVALRKRRPDLVYRDLTAKSDDRGGAYNDMLKYQCDFVLNTTYDVTPDEALVRVTAEVKDELEDKVASAEAKKENRRYAELASAGTPKPPPHPPRPGKPRSSVERAARKALSSLFHLQPGESGWGVKVKLDKQTSKYAVGDFVALAATTPREGYLSLIEYEAAGAITVHIASKPVPAGRSTPVSPYSIQGNNNETGEIYLDKEGTVRLKILVAAEPIPWASVGLDPKGWPPAAKELSDWDLDSLNALDKLQLWLQQHSWGQAALDLAVNAN